eukprot:GHVP01063592.1.p1 GENE.GHVP01063592.1~~GHVP01063592.1.p1  ORF type:complete len:614 (+),score=65.79 GHVP01063592.1:3-1844(+)
MEANKQFGVSISVSGLCLLNSPESDIYYLNGIFKKGTFTGIIGPMDSGKTTLLRTLYMSITGHNKKEGIFLNGKPEAQNTYPGICEIVEEEDCTAEEETALEALQMTAGLKLSHEPELVRDERILKISSLLQIDLKSDSEMKRSSQKRISLGKALITSPCILLIDEPTTNLDFLSAYQAVDILSEEAKNGKTVITTVHQPSLFVLNKFDSILLLSHGFVIFWGTKSDFFRYFLKFSTVFGTQTECIDVLFIDILCGLATGPLTAEPPRRRAETLADHWIQSPEYKSLLRQRDSIYPAGVDKRLKRSSPSVSTQGRILLRRQFRWIIRRRAVWYIFIFLLAYCAFIIIFFSLKLSCEYTNPEIDNSERKQHLFCNNSESLFESMVTALTEINAGIIIGLSLLIMFSYEDMIKKEVMHHYYHPAIFYITSLLSILTFSALCSFVYSISLVIFGAICHTKTSLTSFLLIYIYFVYQSYVVSAKTYFIYSILSLKILSALLSGYLISPGTRGIREMLERKGEFAFEKSREIDFFIKAFKYTDTSLLLSRIVNKIENTLSQRSFGYKLYQTSFDIGGDPLTEPLVTTSFLILFLFAFLENVLGCVIFSHKVKSKVFLK